MNLYSELQVKAMLIAQREICANTYLKNQEAKNEEIAMKIMTAEAPKIDVPMVKLSSVIGSEK